MQDTHYNSFHSNFRLCFFFLLEWFEFYFLEHLVEYDKSVPISSHTKTNTKSQEFKSRFQNNLFFSQSCYEIQSISNVFLRFNYQILHSRSAQNMNRNVFRFQISSYKQFSFLTLLCGSV